MRHKDWDKQQRAETYILDFVLVEIRDAIDDGPRYRTSKIDDFVHDERHDASSKNVVLHMSIPSCPEPLKDIEVDIVFGDILELTPVSFLRRGEEGRGRIPVP